MTKLEILDARSDTRVGYRVDAGRDKRIGRMSSQWFSRPADERYLSLSELRAAVELAGYGEQGGACNVLTERRYR